jgi:hypothetical protein
MKQNMTTLCLEMLETAQHMPTVLSDANPQMVDTIHQCQLLVIPTHST